MDAEIQPCADQLDDRPDSQVIGARALYSPVLALVTRLAEVRDDTSTNCAVEAVEP